MTRFQLVWDDSRTARLRAEGAADLRPLAWLRLSYVGGGHEIGRVDIYTHAVGVSDRLWRGSAASVVGAAAFCKAHAAQLVRDAGETLLPTDVGRAPVHPWALASVVDID